MIKNKQQINWIDSIGIGLFILSSIMEFSGFFRFLFRHFLIISKIDTELIIWIPDVIGLLLVIVISVFVIDIMMKMDHVITRKNLKISMAIFFGIIVIQALYTVFGYNFIRDQYPEEFKNYYNIVSKNYNLQSLLPFVSLFKYIAFGSILLLKRDKVKPEEQKATNQISQIGES